jgi:ribonuclease HI
MKTWAGAGLLFVSPLGEHMRYIVRLHFPASNNMAEYEALLCGLKIAIEIGIKRLDVRGDSQLVIDQVMKNASCHDDKMEAYCKAVWALEDKFYGIELNHVPRLYNEEADELAKIASGQITVPPPPQRLRSGRRPTVRHPRAAPLELHRNLGGSLESSGRRADGRGPLERGVRVLPPRGYGADEVEAMDVEPAPARWTGATSTSPGWTKGNSPRTGPS